MPEPHQIPSRGIKRRGMLCPGTAQLQGSPCTALLPPCLWPLSGRLQPLLQERQDGGALLPPAPGGGGSAVTGCAGAGEVPHALLPQELLSLPTCSPGRHLPAGAERDPRAALAPCALPGEAAQPPVPCAGQGSAQGQPWHTPGSAEQGPWPVSPAPSSLPLKGGTQSRAILSQGDLSHGRQDFGQALPPPCTQSQAWKSCKENREAWSPDLTQQLCPLPVLHGEVAQGLGLGFIHLVDPGTLNKQLLGVFVCSEKVLFNQWRQNTHQMLQESCVRW